MQFRELFSGGVLSRRSVIAILVANSIPLFGVLFFGWDLFSIMFLYWLESAVIGFFNVLKIVKVGRFASLYLVPFFIVHYGGFMVGHLVFIVGFFSPENIKHAFLPDPRTFIDSDILLGAASLFVSHGFSFVHNFLGHEEYRTHDMQTIFNQPYSRIILMHLTIIFGGWMVMLLREPILALCLLIVLKTAADIRAHVKQHKLLPVTPASPSVPSV